MKQGMHPGSGAHMVAPPYNLHTFLTDWQLSPFPVFVAFALIGIALWYVAGVRKLAAKGRRWHPWRTVAFMLGLLSIELALGSSVASLTMFTFVAHITQHLLLMVVAPPLLAMGAPMTMLLQTSSRPTKRRVLKALHSRVFAVLRNQVLVFFLYYLSMYAFFLSPALGYAMAHMWVMDLINLGFLGGASLFWWPMVGLDPIPGGTVSPGFKIINLLIGVPAESFLGIALLMAVNPVAPIYSLQSTHVGGGLLWSASELVTLGAVIPVFFEWVREDARAARRVDAKLAAGESTTPVFEGKGMTATFRAMRRS